MRRRLRLYLALPILYCISCLFVSSSALPCSYKAPRVEDVLFEVPIDDDATETNDIGDDTFIERLANRVPRKVRGRRATSNKLNEDGDEFESLRIHLHYDDSVLKLPLDKQLYVNSSLLPEAAGYWEEVLRVRRVYAPIRLRRKCANNFYYLRPEKRVVACDNGCREITTCGDATIPNSHLLECTYCVGGSTDCHTRGVEGEGVKDADFVLYVTAIPTKRCESPDTLAYAAHCQQEMTLDRPIAGHVNLCPQSLSTHRHDQEILTSTVKHEMLHALGFSVGLYAFFRDSDGKPRTKRNKHGKPPSLNKELGYYDWDKNTITTILREDWWTGTGSVVHPIHVMVTPRVREEARRHFGCTSLEGAELENQGGDGTALTHWEKRIFENEAMTGTHTQNPVYSRMTLALLEDSGWYKPNYDLADNLHWGDKLGCDFVKRSCGEWIKKKRDLAQRPYPFCDEIKHDGRKSLAVTRCTAQRDSVALCNLIPYTKELPPQFRNFEHLKGVNKEGSKHYGGSVELADFCPYSQEFEWKMVNSTTRRDSRCELEGNNSEGEDILEVYGSSSRCFDFHAPWTERQCGRVRSLSHYMAGCYEFACENRTLFVGVHNGTQMYPCYAEGQHVHIKRITDGWLREGSIVCPTCSELCGECNPSIVTNEYIGDPFLDEPCAAARLVFVTVLLVLFQFF